MTRFLAVDWGTTNRRIFLIDYGVLQGVERDGVGALSLSAADYPHEIARLRSTYGVTDIMLAGMVGSNRGWADAGYVAAPATLEDVAHAAYTPLPGVFILPGISLIAGDRADVMRGEEIQFLGAVAAGLIPVGGRLCQPGTHCKWARMEKGAIVDFVTAMTGEMFAIVKDHALVGRDMGGAVTIGAAFDAGIAASADGDLLASLFGARPAVLLGRRSADDSAAFISGLLIGTDVRAHAAVDDTTYMISDAAIGPLYRHAIKRIGGRTQDVDSEAAFVAGILGLRELMQ